VKEQLRKVTEQTLLFFFSLRPGLVWRNYTGDHCMVAGSNMEVSVPLVFSD
jgi:hypothetical protein